MKTLKILSFVLVLIIALSSCSSGTADKDASAPGGNTASSVPEAGTREITDMVGRVVEIPTEVNSFVPLANTPRMITYLGLADKAVGIGGMSNDNITPVTAYAYVNKDLWANIPVVGTDAAGATDYYPEQIIEVNPDVILCSYNKELADEIQTKTGIPVVAVPTGTLFGKDYEDALRLLADVCGVPERAEEVINFINNCLADLSERTENIPDSEKPTVLGAAATFRGAHGIEGVYAKYAVFNAINANDVTEGISDKAGGVLVEKEQILEWDPEYIFFDSGGIGLVTADYAETPSFYGELSAYTDKKMYQYPSSTSYYSNVEIPLVNCYYVAGIICPEQFSDITFEEKANEIFGFFLGDNAYLEKINESGLGYGPVTLGG